VQLIEGLNGSHLWAERYDRPLKDIFAVQDEIVQKIVTTLKLQLSLWEQGLLVRKRTDSLEAYDFFLRGWRELVLSTKETNAEARLLFKKALELDPSYAEVYAALGQTYYWEWWSQWNLDPQNLEQAFVLAQKARDLNDTLPAVHLLLGGIYAQKGQHERALAEAERIVALVPNSALGYAQLGTMLNFVGRPEEALPRVKQAMRLDPRSPIIYLWTLGQTYRLMGRYEEAIAAQKKVLSLYPHYLPAHVHLASLYSELGLEKEARAEATEILRLSPGFSIEAIRQRLPYKDPVVLERFLAALRKAGLK
jgi:adenylate cyclase